MLFLLVINLYVPFGIPFDPKRYYKDGSHTKVAEAKFIFLDYDSTTAALIRGINGVITLSEEYNEGIRHREPGVHEMSDTEMGLDVADTLCFQLGGVRRRVTWRHFILALGLHTEQEMTEAWFGAYWDGSDRAPEKGRKSGARLSRGHFIRRLAMHFGLVSDEGLRGLQGLERKQAAAAGAHEAGLAVEEAALEIPTPTQAPPPPLPAP
ncbi:hypothetical protein Tco_1302500 [Tanacetum coccineum]